MNFCTHRCQKQHLTEKWRKATDSDRVVLFPYPFRGTALRRGNPFNPHTNIHVYYVVTTFSTYGETEICLKMPQQTGTEAKLTTKQLIPATHTGRASSFPPFSSFHTVPEAGAQPGLLRLPMPKPTSARKRCKTTGYGAKGASARHTSAGARYHCQAAFRELLQRRVRGTQCLAGYGQENYALRVIFTDLPRAGSTQLRRLQPRPWRLPPPHTPPCPCPLTERPKPAPSDTPPPPPPPRAPRRHRHHHPPGGRRLLAGGFTWLLPPPLGPQQREVAVGPQPAEQLHQQRQEGAARQRQAEPAAPRHSRPPPPRLLPSPLSGPRPDGSRPCCLQASACPTAAQCRPLPRLPFHPLSPPGRGRQLRTAPPPAPPLRSPAPRRPRREPPGRRGWWVRRPPGAVRSQGCGDKRRLCGGEGPHVTGG